MPPKVKIGRSRFICRSTLLFVILISLVALLSQIKINFHVHPRLNRVPRPLPTQRILSWTSFFGNTNYLPRNLNDLGCKVDNCVTTNNRSHVHMSDAIIFHWSDIDLRDMPYKVNSKHKWVLYNYEPPPLESWDKMIPIISKMTWMATYRLDSDIVTPYGLYGRKSSKDKHESDIRVTREEFERKKPVVWLVSHCKTSGKREDFVNDMKRHVEVDVFGLCGVPAPCEGTRITCYGKLAKLYKFYLSFENSVCKDYATEKVFLPLTVGLVPVVFGGANYSRIVPPDSFIDALAFQTPKDLADHLLEVGRNFSLYQKYQKWRDTYKIVQNEAPDFHWLCELCQLLHEEKPHKSAIGRRVDQDTFYDWWFTGGRCSVWNAGLHTKRAKGNPETIKNKNANTITERP